MGNEEYLYFRRRAREEGQAARAAISIKVQRVHEEFAAAYQLRCRELGQENNPAPGSARFH